MRHLAPLLTLLLTAPIVATGPGQGLVAQVPKGLTATAQVIREEFTRSNQDPIGHPLPLAAHWSDVNYNAPYILEKIRAGHYVIPTFPLVWPPLTQVVSSELQDALVETCSVGLPFVIKSSQWERILNEMPVFYELPFETSPHAFDLSGDKTQNLKFDPMYPSDTPFYDAGTLWGQQSALELFQSLCPEPSSVMFLSNNENRWLTGGDFDSSKRYVDLHGLNTSWVEKVQVYDDLVDAHLAQAWPTGHRSPLHRGIHDTLIPSWQDNVFFVGFNAFGPRFYARWYQWHWYIPWAHKYISIAPAFWDGGSGDFYLDNWDVLKTDDKVFGLQVETQNWVFMKEKAIELNPDFRFEMSVWDGEAEHRDSSFLSGDVPFDETRYRALIEFGMWLVKPRVIREFRPSFQALNANESYFSAILDAVKSVHENETLRRFWRKGQLVANPMHEHPYQTDLHAASSDEDRWFMLDNDLDPPRPWALSFKLPVFALALKLAEGGQTEWLVYAHSPSGTKQNVRVTVPGYGDIAVDIPIGGAYYLLRGGTTVVERVYADTPSGPLNAPPYLESYSQDTGLGMQLEIAADVTEPDEIGDLLTVEIAIRSPISTSDCSLRYHQTGGKFYVRGGPDNSWQRLGSVDLEGNGCIVKVPGTTVTSTGSTVSLALSLQFAPEFGQSMAIFVRMEDRAGNVVPWAQVGDVLLMPDPVAYWRFDETAAGSGTILLDDTGNGHDAVAAGSGTSSSSNGVVGSSRTFSGPHDYALVQPHPQLSADSFTFSTWVKHDTAAGDHWSVLYSNFGADLQGWFVGMSDGHPVLSVGNAWLLTASPLQVSEWHHLAVTFHGPARRGRIYIDGTLVRSAVFPRWTPQVTASPTFGRASWYSGAYFRGSLDETLLYNVELDPQSILSIFDLAQPDASQKPVAYWPFDESGTGAGTILFDAIQGQHNATTAGAGTEFLPNGISGGARRFRGPADYVTLNPHPDLGSSDFSFMAWVKLEDSPSNWSVIFSNYGGDYVGWFVGAVRDGHVILSVSGPPASSPWLISNTPLVRGEWHHLAVTFNSSTRIGRILIDGHLDRSAVFPAWAPQTSVIPTFGRASWYNGAFLKGSIDEAKLYSYTLTPSEVARVFESQ